MINHGGKGNAQKEKPTCTYGRVGHVIDKFYELHGSSWFQTKRKGFFCESNHWT